MDIVKEVWKDVKDYEGLYEVSDHGNVRVKDREVISRWGTEYVRPEKILSPDIDKDGYCVASLRKDSINKRFKIHRLVAMTFIPNPENKPTVNHKNGIKDDNCITNLEWMNHKEQRKHAEETGLFKVVRGTQCRTSKLNEEKVREIKRLLFESDLTQKQIADKFEVSPGRITEIKNGKSWKHVQVDYDYTKRNENKGLSRESNPSTKLPTEQVQEINKILEEKTLSQREIAKLYNVSQSLIGYLNKKRKS